jgi:hypothetical protein
VTEAAPDAEPARWSGQHDGYLTGETATLHRRGVVLDRAERTLTVTDWLEGSAGHDVRIAFHLGPEVRAVLDGAAARLAWPAGSATVELPAGLAWSAHRGQTEPPLGWYSPRFGQKVPATTLLGAGRVEPGTPLTSVFRFAR